LAILESQQSSAVSGLWMLTMLRLRSRS